MTFQFLLQSTPIEHSEAVALMEVAQPNRAKPFEIDLEKVINFSSIDSKQLFEMAVKHENPNLASLAFKMSVRHKDLTTTTPTVARPQRTTKAKETIAKATVDELIAKLHDSHGYWATGAALLIASTRQSEWTTLKDVAVKYVNHAWTETDMPIKSVVFKGFKPTGRDANGDWDSFEPLELQPGVERKDTFHVSPIYIGLREGLGWCRRNNLIEQKSGISVGPVRSNASERSEKMQRVYYKIRATEKGERMKAMWADVDDYIFNFFKSRLM